MLKKMCISFVLSLIAVHAPAAVLNNERDEDDRASVRRTRLRQLHAKPRYVASETALKFRG